MFQTITEKSLEARKNKNKVHTNLFTTILGEVQQAEKKVKADRNTITLDTLKKFRDSALQVLSVSPLNEVAREELEILNSLLPQPLSPEKTIEIVERVCGNWSEDKGNKTAFVMNWFKANYHVSQYDAKTISQLVNKK
ncbi:tRNA amidotransferase [Acinetobacter phage vB_AbaM_ME3]|uniref:Aspartyl-tRNA amidotransferase subunit B n=1 Tax=Acinetobacter phage vB_AbaM_ME3 TaxID=1837876 RepID=A0A172Q0M1_9CAUD|nr:tRNA amidotransferase [Acinetobacter phage vB_AbaM_ME3]AND75394.1 aspartyl-tRNA amidotransferase subunit B [Acinetobacter phage vB_AbaM_ME3]